MTIALTLALALTTLQDSNAIDRAVQRTTRGGFWGTVLVARGGKILHEKGYGFADYASRPNTPRTLFEIASTSKQVAAAAILKLEMEGKLSLNDPITKFFKDVPDDKKKITLHQMLTHTSGISPNVGIAYAAKHTRDEMVAHHLKPELKSKPGEKYAYCNAAYAMLAAVVEVASGGTFEAYVKEKLFKPAGMTDTGFVQDKSLDVKRVTARLSKYQPEATTIDWHWSWGYRGMGGVVTTARDLLKWDRALRGNSVLNAAARKKFYTPYRKRYALGWFVKTTARGTTLVNHGGGVAGYNVQYVRYLQEDVVIVILSNGGTKIYEVDRAIRDVLFPPPQIKASIDVKPYELSKYRAVRVVNKAKWTVTKKGDRIHIVLRDSDKKHDLASIDLPATYGKKLISDLEAALKGKKDDGVKKPVLDAGVYLNSYAKRGKRFTLDRKLEIKIMPRYVGRGSKGEEIVDERAVFVLQDNTTRNWPIMVHMNRAAVLALKKAVE